MGFFDNLKKGAEWVKDNVEEQMRKTVSKATDEQLRQMAENARRDGRTNHIVEEEMRRRGIS